MGKALRLLAVAVVAALALAAAGVAADAARPKAVKYPSIFGSTEKQYYTSEPMKSPS